MNETARMRKSRTVALIIARMTSSRLPGKQMRDINGQPMIFHIIERLKQVKALDQIVLATASKEENQELAQYAKKFGVETFFDDDENNVTGRIARAAQYFKAKNFVTISGDCPLIHPDFIERGIAQLQQNSADYVYIDKDKYECLHEGIGFYTTDSWLKLDELSTTWFHKEHPGSVLSENTDRFTGVEIMPETAFQQHDFRMSVDTVADLEFMNQVYSELQQDDEIVSLYEVVNLVDSKPFITLLNEHVHQRGITEKSRTVAIITHAGQGVGLGHLSRCIALARELKETQSMKVVFYINEEETAKTILSKNGFVFTTWSTETQFDSVKKEVLEPYSVSGIVIDIKGDKGKCLQQWLTILAQIDLPRFAIDYIPENPDRSITCIVPTVYHQRLAMFPGRSQQNLIWGKDYLLLNRKINFWRENEYVEKNDIVVTAGGSGRHTEPLLRALAELSRDIKIKFVVGPFSDPASLESGLKDFDFRNYEIIFNPPDPYKIYRESELAISTFGVTTYELIALGVPTVVVNTSSASDGNIVAFMARQNVCVNALSFASNTEKFVDEIRYLMANETIRDHLGEEGMLWIDAFGVERVAELINAAIETNEVKVVNEPMLSVKQE